MAQTPELVIYYARCLAKRVGGHPLHSAKPIDPFPNFLVDGTDLFDVAWINDTGRLSYGFSAALGPNAPRNMDGNRSLLPPNHERYTGGDLSSSRQIDPIAPGYCYQSWTKEKTSVAADTSVALAATPAGTVSVGGEVSFTIAEDASALLYLPKPHAIIMSRHLNLSANYAKKHTARWYRFLNGDNQNNTIRNGDLYFVTSCFKTTEWHNACTFSCHKATGARLTFHPTSQIGAGFSGQFDRGSGAIAVHEGPGTQEDRDTQCVVVVGWKLALCSRFLRIAMVPVSVNKAAESTFSSKFFGRSNWQPYSSKQTTLSKVDPTPSEALPSALAKANLATLSRRPLARYRMDNNGHERVLCCSCLQGPDSENEKVVAASGDMVWIDAASRGNENLPQAAPLSSHALTDVFPYIEESAPWMNVVIAHDTHYLSVVQEGEIVPLNPYELAKRLMRRFVIDTDEDLNGMLVDREEANLTSDELAFVVHNARHWAPGDVGFDVIRKNIPAGWNLVSPKYGLGVAKPDCEIHGWPCWHPRLSEKDQTSENAGTLLYQDNLKILQVETNLHGGLVYVN